MIKKDKFTQPKKTGSPSRILVVDDDEAIVEAMQIMLEMEGYKVETSSDGDTVNKVKKIIPDLVLLDIWMSGQDGRIISKRLKAQENTKNIPIIIVSASKDIKKDAINSGADDFLEKPFEMDDLLKKVAINLKK